MGDLWRCAIVRHIQDTTDNANLLLSAAEVETRRVSLLVKPRTLFVDFELAQVLPEIPFGSFSASAAVGQSHGIGPQSCGKPPFSF